LVRSVNREICMIFLRRFVTFSLDCPVTQHPVFKQLPFAVTA